MSLYQCSTEQVTTSEVNWPFNVFPFMFINMSFRFKGPCNARALTDPGYLISVTLET